MSSRRNKATASLYHKLRDATHSSSVNKTSILVDASNYIQELKAKVESLHQEIGSSQDATTSHQLPMQVSVEAVEKGFRINVISEMNCPGLLVAILGAFEKLGLEVLDARVSCQHNFQLQALGGESAEEADDSMDAQVVKQAVLQAINKWSLSH